MGLRVTRHADAAAFLQAAEAWLLRAEAEYNLLLGLAHRLARSTTGYEPPIYLATIEDDEGVVGCAFRTPPFKLGLTRMPLAALPLLVDDVATVYDVLPAVLGPDPEARELATRWSALRGGAVHKHVDNRIYQLDRVTPPPRLPSGHMRPATPADLDLLAGWAADFAGEAAVEDPGRARVRQMIADGGLVVWEDEGVRSMAASLARTPHGARIGYVYTPPAGRGRGYASACVAALSQRVLDAGAQFCFLYTDLANPTSNAIYARIGYRPVADVVEYLFVPGDDSDRVAT